MTQRPYRGKRIDNGEWVEGWYAEFDKPVIISDEGKHLYRVDPDTVGQYTGLHDDSEDQAEVFKGDITQIEYEGVNHICVIDYFAGSFAFVADSLPDGYMYLNQFAEYDHNYGWVEKSIKLGNHWDNPELMEG